MSDKIKIIIAILLFLTAIVLAIFGSYLNRNRKNNISLNISENIGNNEIIDNSSENVSNVSEETSNEVSGSSDSNTLNTSNTSADSDWKKATGGIITEIDEETVKIVDEKESENYLIVKNVKLVNYRTGEEMKLSDVEIGDYCAPKFDGSIEIVRNISGKEWEEECKKNMAYRFDGDSLCCNPADIIEVEDMNEYLLMTLSIYDTGKEFFTDDKEKCQFEMTVEVPTDIEIESHSGITVYNLKDRNSLMWIKLDEDTLDNKYPTVETIEVYDG